MFAFFVVILLLVPNFLATPVPFKLNEDAGLSVFKLIEKYGYPLEKHDVTTEDGYILQLHRIPHGLNNQNEKDKPPILVMHGLMSSSADWVNSGADKSLGFLLADAGYDVWLGNSRGNFWSQKHITLDPKLNESKFWDFSFHEMGIYDLPASIDHILETTGQKQIFYTGHSQGTTQFFVMVSERSVYQNKVRLMQALSPVSYLANAKNVLFKMIAENINSAEWIFNNLGKHQFLPSGVLNGIGQELCRPESPFVETCANLLFMICGPNPAQLDKDRIPVYLTNIPAGSSSKSVIHFAQLKKFDKFAQFSYSEKKNMEIYGQKTAPAYDLSKSTVPMAFYYGANDYLLNATDATRLYAEIGSGVLLQEVSDPLFNHLDFLWSIDVLTVLYEPLLTFMKKY